MDDLSERLAHAPVFSKLVAADRAELARFSRHRTYQKGEVICRQDEIWPNVIYVAAGRAEWAMLSPEGKRQVVFALSPGDVMWGHSLFDDLPMPAALEVMEACEAYLWPREIIVPVISRNCDAMWDVSRTLVWAMRRVREVVYGFAFHPVAGRLARLLLQHYRPVEGRPAPRDLTLDEMADTVGTTRELVSKTLHRFADEGLIRINRMEFVFTDRGRLEELAGTNALDVNAK